MTSTLSNRGDLAVFDNYAFYSSTNLGVTIGRIDTLLFLDKKAAF